MLKSLHLKNFTVFPDAEFTFGKDLNVIVGENGAGKSHVLKAAYAAIAVSAAREQNGGTDLPSKGRLQAALADKLIAVFRPDGLWRLVRRQRGRSKCSLSYTFDEPDLDLKFTFSTVAKTEVTIEATPSARAEKLPIFLPTRELLTICPGFVSLYETTHLAFEETWRDTCILLDAPLARGPREARIRQLLAPLEEAMGGSVELDKSRRFYLKLDSGSMEMHLVAEGLRKLATIARLIATGSLLDKGYLFWDEPDANLNPKIVKTVAKTVLQIAEGGIQVSWPHTVCSCCANCTSSNSDVSQIWTRAASVFTSEKNGAAIVQQGRTMDEIGSIAALDEDLQQSERYVDTEMGVPLTTATNAEME